MPMYAILRQDIINVGLLLGNDFILINIYHFACNLNHVKICYDAFYMTIHIFPDENTSVATLREIEGSCEYIMKYNTDDILLTLGSFVVPLTIITFFLRSKFSLLIIHTHGRT